MEGGVHARLQQSQAVHLHEHPQLEGVHFAATLDALVAGVVTHVVEFILLEEVRGARRVALLQQILCRETEGKVLWVRIVKFSPPLCTVFKSH